MTPDQPTDAGASPPPKRSSRRPLFILGGVILVVLIAAGVAIAVAQNREPKGVWMGTPPGKQAATGVPTPTPGFEAVRRYQAEARQTDGTITDYTLELGREVRAGGLTLAGFATDTCQFDPTRDVQIPFTFEARNESTQYQATAQPIFTVFSFDSPGPDDVSAQVAGHLSTGDTCGGEAGLGQHTLPLSFELAPGGRAEVYGTITVKNYYAPGNDSGSFGDLMASIQDQLTCFRGSDGEGGVFRLDGDLPTASEITRAGAPLGLDAC